MRGHRFFLGLIGVVLLVWTASPATADMESLTDDQMGAVQGLSGTIVSAHTAAPKTLIASDTPGIVNTTGVVFGDNGRQVLSPGSISKDIHPTLSSPDVLFSINVGVSSVTHYKNDTRAVEAWSGNRFDF